MKSNLSLDKSASKMIFAAEFFCDQTRVISSFNVLPRARQRSFPIMLKGVLVAGNVDGRSRNIGGTRSRVWELGSHIQSPGYVLAVVSSCADGGSIIIRKPSLNFC